METVLTAVEKLTKDLKTAAVTLSVNEARYLVDAYYQIQEYRKATANQVRALGTNKEPHEVIGWLRAQHGTLEAQVQKALDNWSAKQPVGQWARSITGIGPVIATGLLAHIDITKAPTAGHIWRFAGLDPTSKWGKGEKRPWNASLKTLCWKIGESFVKVSNNKNDFYGKLYQQRKELETKNNDEFKYKDQAEQKLKDFKIGKDTDAYAAYSIGKLPPAHIHARAKRYAVKMFLSHYQMVAYRYHHGTDAPAPFPIAHLGHVDLVPVPNWPF